MGLEYAGIFLGISFLLAYFLPIVVCIVLAFRWGRRSDSRLVPMMVVIILLLLFIHN